MLVCHHSATYSLYILVTSWIAYALIRKFLYTTCLWFQTEVLKNKFINRVYNASRRSWQKNTWGQVVKDYECFRRKRTHSIQYMKTNLLEQITTINHSCRLQGSTTSVILRRNRVQEERISIIIRQRLCTYSLYIKSYIGCLHSLDSEHI
jgi:hypothetical protein